jgi:hypothetical protein
VSQTHKRYGKEIWEKGQMEISTGIKWIQEREKKGGWVNAEDMKEIIFCKTQNLWMW